MGGGGVNPPSGIITLLTDFGVTDPFVGMMKGVILSRFPAARIVDLTHGVPPQNVEVAAFWLGRSFPWFPAGTVHLAVVDPGVGSTREQLVARSHGHYFVAPDNGLLAATVSSDPLAEVRSFSAAELGLGAPSATFHGRDVFAPAAADLASGRRAFDTLGRRAAPAVGALAPGVRDDGGIIRGQVLLVDHFGNLFTNVEAAAVAAPTRVELLVGGEVIRLLPPGGSYAAVGPGELTALVNAHGMLEIAERDGNAAVRLGIGPGAEVVLRPRLE